MRASLQANWITARVGLELFRRSIATRATALSVAVPVVVVVLAVLASATQAAERGPRPSQHYSGETFKGGPIVFTMSRDGSRITWVVAAIELNCTDGTTSFQTVYVDSWRSLRVSRSSKFGSAYQDSVPEEGVTVDISGTISGRFDRRRTSVSGHWALKWVTHQPDGASVTCDSGSLGFDAER